MSAPPSDPLEQQRRAEQRAALARRKQFRRSPEGVLAQSMVAALTLRDQMRADGATPAELHAFLERTVREAWPKGREAEWKDLCAECSDYGLRMATCPGDASCGRTRRHGSHEYGTACWCPKGERFRAKPKTEQSNIESAARVGKPTRFGR